MDPSLTVLTEALKPFLTFFVSTASPKVEALVSLNARFQGKFFAYKRLLGVAKEDRNKGIDQQSKILKSLLEAHLPLQDQLTELWSSYQNEVEFMNSLLPVLSQVRNDNVQHRKSLEENHDVVELLAKVESLRQEIENLRNSLESDNRDLILSEDDHKKLLERYYHQESLCRASQNNGSISKTSEESELGSNDASS